MAPRTGVPIASGLFYRPYEAVTLARGDTRPWSSRSTSAARSVAGPSSSVLMSSLVPPAARRANLPMASSKATASSTRRGSMTDSPPYTGRPGMASPGWRHAEADPQILERACGFIASAAARSGPFFAYVALDAPHEPCTPEVVPPIALGRSRAGPRGDLVWFVDHAAGRLRHALEDAGVWDNTIFVVTSDNGALPGDRVIDGSGTEVYRTDGHRSSGPWRGFKAHIWEGGHREPLIISWPGRVEAGRRRLKEYGLPYGPVRPPGQNSSAKRSLATPRTASALLRRSAAPSSVVEGNSSLVHHSQRGVFALRPQAR